MTINIDGSKGIRQNTTEVTKIPVGTTAQRPANPEAGMIRFNTDRGFVEWYDPITDIWSSVAFDGGIVAAGGTVTDIQQDGQLFRVHTFTSSGTFDVTRGGEVDVLVVGGGGSGGTHHGGGGGAGGLVYKSNHTITSESYTLTVGDGGNGVFTPDSNTSDLEGNPGQDSSFDGFLGRGGGGGFGYDRSSSNLANGGSGGGASNWNSAATGGSATQPGTNPSADIDAGHAGNSTPSTEDFGGGGGGAGGPGGGGYRDMNGGTGLDFSSIFGTLDGDDGWFAGGGGAGNYSNPGTNTTDTGFGNGGPNEKGGGGRGGVTLSGKHDEGNESGTQGSDGPLVPEIDGINGTGGGGGGVPTYYGVNKCSGFGGSGIVIVRYRIG